MLQKLVTIAVVIVSLSACTTEPRTSAKPSKPASSFASPSATQEVTGIYTPKCEEGEVLYYFNVMAENSSVKITADITTMQYTVTGPKGSLLIVKIFCDTAGRELILALDAGNYAVERTLS